MKKILIALFLMFSFNIVSALEVEPVDENLPDTDTSVLKSNDMDDPVFGLGDNLQGPNSHLQYNTIPVSQGMKVQQPKL